MKKLIFILLVIAFACEPAKKAEKEIVPNEIGYQITEDGSKIALYSDSKSTIQVWENYIKAHNEKDTTAIRNLNSVENFKAYAPTGELIDGSDAHIAFLSKWFVENNPQWTTKYMIANEYTNKEGKLYQWITSGHDLTLTADETEIKLNQVHDALIVDGKVQLFYVNERVQAPGE